MTAPVNPNQSPTSAVADDVEAGKEIDVRKIAEEFRYEHFWALRNITGQGFQKLIEELLTKFLSSPGVSSPVGGVSVSPNLRMSREKLESTAFLPPSVEHVKLMERVQEDSEDKGSAPETSHARQKERFGKIQQSLVTCEWCDTRLIKLRGSRVFDEPKRHVKYVGWCPECNSDSWSQDITPRMAQEGREASEADSVGRGPNSADASFKPK